MTAAPLVTYFQERWPMSRAAKVRAPRRDPADTGAVV